MSEHLHSARVEGCYRCELGKDEEASSVVEELIESVTAAINLILPRATVMMRGDGWILTREGNDE